MISNDGWLQNASRCLSPNRDARPADQQVSLLVIHNISLPPGVFGGRHINDFFTNQLQTAQHPYFSAIAELRVSTHLLIDRNGDVIQFVPFHERAWHAGLSCFEKQERCNDFSIGIELEGTDIEPYTDRQYGKLCRVTKSIMNSFPEITLQRIVGHADIAPGRKSDPGISFDWHRYLTAVKEADF